MRSSVRLLRHEAEYYDSIMIVFILIDLARSSQSLIIEDRLALLILLIAFPLATGNWVQQSG